MGADHTAASAARLPQGLPGNGPVKQGYTQYIIAVTSSSLYATKTAAEADFADLKADV